MKPIVPASRTPICAPIAAVKSATTPAPLSIGLGPSGVAPITESPLNKPLEAKHIAVSGIGVAGLMAAYSAINRAAAIGLEKLTVLDVRDHSYVLEIGFNFRPEHLRMMAVMSPKAARKLFEMSGLLPGNESNVFQVWDSEHQTAVAKLSKELFELCNISGKLSDDTVQEILESAKHAPSMADYAHKVVDQDNICVVTAKELESVFFEGLAEAAAKNNVAIDYRPFSTIKVTEDAAGKKSYATESFVDADGKPVKGPLTPGAAKVSSPIADLDVLFVAEGAGGAKSGTRAATGALSSRAITPVDQRWMAGVIKDPSITHGLARYHEVTLPDGGHLRAVRTDHAVNGNQWRLTEVPKGTSLDPVALAEIPAADVTRLKASLGTPTDLAIEKAFHGERLEKLYRSLTSAVGSIDPDLACHNAFGQKGPPGPFTLSGRAYDKAVLADGGSDLPLTVALGDCVLNSTFNVSLGAGTSLIEYIALDAFWDQVEAKAPLGVATSALERDLMQAAHVWGVSGITQFDGDPRELIAAYYPKEEMDKVFPAEIVARYYGEDGKPRVDSENRYWKGWVPPEPDEAKVIEATIKAAKKAPKAQPSATM